jgi:glycerol-3-phosphate dehydrogenase (NAD(P)+)
MTDIAVIGGGAWGTALAAVIAGNGAAVTLYAREKDAVDSINSSNINKPFLPEITLPKSLKATSNLADVAAAKIILLTTPAQFFRAQLQALSKHNISHETAFVICSKGIENESLELLSEIFEDNLKNQYAILSGPTFAGEVASGMVTSISLASKNIVVAENIKKLIERPTLTIHVNNDVVGSQVCGAVKNVIAIGCGIVRGLGQGENCRAAIVTKGFHEIMKINGEMWGKAETLLEPCGIGDLVLTCSSEKSRNFSFGMDLGQKKSQQQILQGKLSVVEGVATSRSVVNLAKKLKISLPLCEKINDIIEGRSKPEEILTLV